MWGRVLFPLLQADLIELSGQRADDGKHRRVLRLEDDAFAWMHVLCFVYPLMVKPDLSWVSTIGLVRVVMMPLTRHDQFVDQPLCTPVFLHGPMFLHERHDLPCVVKVCCPSLVDDVSARCRPASF